MSLKSISRSALYYSRHLKSKGPPPPLLDLAVTAQQKTHLHIYKSSRFVIVTPPARSMSDGNSKETDEDKHQKNEKVDDCTTSSKDKSTAKEGGSSKETAAEKESSPLKYATRTGFTKHHQNTVKESKDKFLSMSKDEKRKLYKCKGRYVSLDKILTWPELFQEKVKEDANVAKWWNRHKKEVRCDVKGDLNSKISIFRGDITSLEIDAIVNAANETLLGGGGVDGAIHAAAGPLLLSECELLDGCKGGEAKITCGYKLPARYVIHTVGPRGENPDMLKSCYTQCLDLLKENQLKSAAFPCISTGIFGYPNENAAVVALQAVRNWLDQEDYSENIERIIFCLFLPKDVDIYERQVRIFFPLDQGLASGTDDTHL